MKPQSHTKNILSAITLALSILASSSTVFSAEWEIEWEKVYKSDDGERAYCVKQTDDGGYVVGGTRGETAYVLKIDKNGTLEWDQTYPTDDEVSSFYTIGRTNDGGYILSGSTGIPPRYDPDADEQYPGSFDAYIIKISNAGVKEWSKIYPYSSSGNVICIELQQTIDGGYISLCSGLKKLDSTGNIVWQKTISGNSLYQKSDGGYVIGQNIFIEDQIWQQKVIHTNDQGDILFERFVHEGEGNPYSMIYTKKRDYLFYGDPNNDISLIRLDKNGNSVWQKLYLYTYPQFRFFSFLSSGLQSIDGGFILTGNKEDKSRSDDIFAIKIDGYGNIQWEISSGGAGDDTAYAIEHSQDGGYIIAGHTSSFPMHSSDYNAHLYLVKLAPEPRPKLQNDLNGDGWSDLVLKEKSSGRASLLMMEDDGSTWTVSYSSNWGDKYDLLGTGDLNGDGRDDMILKYRPSETVYLCEMNTDASSWNVSYYSQGFYAKYDLLGIGDLNGDKRDDLILKYKPSNTVYICLLNEPGAAKIWTVSYYSQGWAENYSVLGVADLNDDARDDLILQYNPSGTVYFCHMREDGASWDVAATESWTDGQTLLALADLNADFRKDLLVGDTHGHATAWIANPDATTWTKTPLGDWSAYEILFTGDLNADHRDDLIRQTRATGQVEFLLTAFDNPTSWTVSYSADWSDLELLSR